MAAVWHSYHSLPEDVWNRLEFPRDRPVVIAHTRQNSNEFYQHNYFPSQNNGIPTPPHSPSEPELDHLLATIPEILETPTSSTPQEFKDILSDLENSTLGSFFCGPPLPQYGAWCSLNAPPPPPLTCHPEKNDPLKKDIMWGGGIYGSNSFDSQKSKPRTISDSSDDNRSVDLPRSSFYLEEEESEHLPDTPCVSDTDVDEEPLERETSSKGPISIARDIQLYSTASVCREHNYCEQIPNFNASIDSSSDTDEEIDVVSWCELPDSYIHNSNLNTTCSSISSTLTATLSSIPQKSAQVKRRQLQIAIQEVIKTRRKLDQPKASEGKLDAASPKPIMCSRSTPFDNIDIEIPAIKIRTQGKPAAYTKRMREQHSEVLKTNKRRKVAKDNGDEEEKRNNHNFMERNRRVSLKAHFDVLRDHIPEIQYNERASKVLILRKAFEYIKKYEPELKKSIKKKDKLTRKQQYLTERLDSLKELHGIL